MAEIREHRPHPHQLQVHSQPGGSKAYSQKGPSPGQILALITLLPLGGSLLGLAGIILLGTLIGLAVATPLFVIFSPVLIPAAILIVGTVTAILTSGAFGLTGLSSLSWVLSSFRQATGREPLEYAKQRMQETARQAGEVIGETTKQTRETIKSKAQETGTGTGTGTHSQT